jgi:Na+-driven multidrug efflux pump
MFLPRCGIMMIFVDVLFVVRNCVQGMGKPMLPMASGILEMFLRIFVISFLMSRLGFKATAYAEISAWIGALAVNAFALNKYLAPLLAASEPEPEETEPVIHGRWRRKLHGSF